jgi:hypothetical protein
VAQVLGSSVAAAQTIDLYVDESSGQVFTKPGPGRSHLGKFKRVDERAEAAPAPVKAAPKRPAPPSAVPVEAAPEPPAPPPTVPVEAMPPREEPPATVEAKAPEPEAPKTLADEESMMVAFNKALKKKWYERISIGGYVQLRYTALLSNDGEAEWFVPGDRSASEGSGLFLRRARIKFSGQVTDHLYVYIQPELSGSPSSGDFSVQLRDAYADVSIDRERENRFRFGQSKVPFGFVNLQSSQNRLPLERAESINSAVEGEREVGIFYYWAPAEIRDRFSYLVKSGLKGSGDYGVVGLGIYNGQGPNRLDLNDNVYVVGRVSYPFKFASGQFFEPGIQGYVGRFVPRVEPIGDPPMDPRFFESGVVDQRLAVSAVYYPQPIGFETEWTVGEGPELVDDARIESKFLWGGYAQLYYQHLFRWGVLFPFVRWQYFDGGRKYARNAPHADLDEWDFGVEWQILPELEFTIDYAFAPTRTNTSEYPYLDIEDGSRLGLQVQWNY